MEPDIVNPQPRHLWIVGFLSLMWNGFGAWDYTMTNIRDPGYLAQFPPEMMQVIDALPYWTIAAWALGVWGALAGSLLLLLRSRFAVPAFAVSLAGLAASQAYQATLDMPAALTSPGMTAMTLAIWAAAIGFLVYAMRMKKARALR